MAHADVMGDRIFVQTHWNEKDQIRQIPGSRWKSEHKVWTVPLSWAACVQLRGVFQDNLSLGQDLINWASAERKQRIDISLRHRNSIEPQFTRLHDKLYPFQRAGVEWLNIAESALLADEMGTGKTIQILELLNVLHKSEVDYLPALVISPNGVKHNWFNETVKWSPHLHPYVVAGSARRSFSRSLTIPMRSASSTSNRCEPTHVLPATVRFD